MGRLSNLKWLRKVAVDSGGYLKVEVIDEEIERMENMSDEDKKRLARLEAREEAVRNQIEVSTDRLERIMLNGILVQIEEAIAALIPKEDDGD